jgi:GNAT superfamily N-acetyltransferase
VVRSGAVRDDGILIRQAKASDFPLLWPLLREMGKTDAEEQVGRRFVDLVRSSQHFLPVAILGGEVAGYAWAQDFGPHLRDGASTVRLHDLFVASAWRRRGIGSRLFGAVRTWAMERGATWLQWSAGPASRAFYERLGLAPEPEDPAYPAFELELRAPHWKARSPDARLEEAEAARGRMA